MTLDSIIGLGSHEAAKVEWDLSLYQHIVASMGQPSCVYHGAKQPFLRATRHHQGGLVGAIWLPMGLYILCYQQSCKLAPGPPGVIGRHTKRVQPGPNWWALLGGGGYLGIRLGNFTIG